MKETISGSPNLMRNLDVGEMLRLREQLAEAEAKNRAPDYPRCETCRFWMEINASDEPEPLGKCRHAAINHWQPGYVYDSSKIWEADEDPEWFVGTGPRFGCVHHEAKTQSTGTAQ